MGAWIDAVLGRIFNRGTEVDYGEGLDFKAPLKASLNSSTGLIDVEIEDDAVGIDKTSPVDADSYGAMFLLTIPFTAGAGGSADDVTVYDNDAPYSIQIVRARLNVTTNVGGSTVQGRSASGGGGSVIIGSLSSASLGYVEDDGGGTISSGGSLYLRRSDSGVAGTYYVEVVRV